MLELFLVSQRQSFSIEALIWGTGLCLLLAFVVLYFYQRRIGKSLESELSQLGNVTKHNVEYELVLKAMKLCTWHIDVPERTITYDNDFRNSPDCFVPVGDKSIEQVADAMVEADQARIRKALNDFCDGMADEYHEISRVVIPHSKKYYWTESYATIASRDADGKPKLIVGTSMRIDDRKSMETALVEARNKAEESDRLKSAFIANMSHEIRTPLNAIIGFTSVLPDVTEESERRELINLIQENNQKLLRIVDDVMNISKIESGKEPLKGSAFELNDILMSSIEQFAGKLKPGVALSTELPLSMMEVNTDLGRLMEILTHLLTNAVKFTNEGSIVLGYDAPKDGRIKIWVRDTGIGIAPKHHKSIFERFFKVDEYVPGAGLGLSISRTMALSMGGDIGVESQLGEGAKFWLEIPIK